MQVSDPGQFHNSWYCFKDILKKEGPAALYSSYPTTLIMSIPFQAIQFSTYEYLRTHFKRILRSRQDEYAPLVHILSGGMAGGVASAVTTPLDAVKTAIQTRGLADQQDIQWRRLKGLQDAIRMIYARSGWRGFIRGILPRMMTHAPSTAICWTVYEYFKWSLQKYHFILSPMEKKEFVQDQMEAIRFHQ